MMGTGGGSPKDLQLSVTENTLLNFLTPDASGLKKILEGGFTNVIPSYDNNKTFSSSALYNIEEKENEIEEVFSNNIFNDEMLYLESYETHFLIQQNKQSAHMSLLSNMRNIHVKQKAWYWTKYHTKVNKYDETFVSSLHNIQNVQQNKENWVCIKDPFRFNFMFNGFMD